MTAMDIALEADGLGKRYGRRWALRDCSFALPAGRVSALVGRNGAGKTTLMALACGIRDSTEGDIRVFGGRPGPGGMPAELSYLAQDKPLYGGFSVSETLKCGARLNPGWDDGFAQRLIAEADIPPKSRVRALSGGQRTRLALIVALARRPRLLLLDEPLAELDPLARKEVMSTVMTEVADTGMSVVMSSHFIADLERSCDHLMVMTDGRIRIAGDVDDLLADHRVAVGPAGPVPFPADSIVEYGGGECQSTVLLSGAVAAPDDWTLTPSNLDELVLAYLAQAGSHRAAAASPKAVTA